MELTTIGPALPGSISRPAFSRVANAFACVQVANSPNSCSTIGPGRSSVERHTTAVSPQYFAVNANRSRMVTRIPLGAPHPAPQSYFYAGIVIYSISHDLII